MNTITVASLHKYADPNDKKKPHPEKGGFMRIDVFNVDHISHVGIYPNRNTIEILCAGKAHIFILDKNVDLIVELKKQGLIPPDLAISKLELDKAELKIACKNALKRNSQK